MLNPTLHQLGFGTTHPVAHLASIDHLFPQRQHCGIYVLHFTKGTYYVGQSRDVVQRYQQHRHTYPNEIAFLSFRKVAQKYLDQEEIRTIREMEAAGFLLLNILHTSMTYQSSDFDLLMRPEDQRRWLTDLTWIDATGPRPILPDQQEKTLHKFTALQKRPEYQDVLAILRQYVWHCIPAFKRTERSHWSVSCLPMTLGGRRLVTVNMNTMETLFLERNEYGGGAALNSALSPFRSAYPTDDDFYDQHPNTTLYSTDYEAAGFDQIGIETKSLRDMHTVLADPAVQAGSRLLNLQLMRKRGVFFGRSHCVALVDALGL